MSISVAIVEDDEGIRESLRILIDGAEGFDCSGAYSSAEEALENIPALKPSVVLMDINLPKMSGIECIILLKNEHPEIQFVMLTVYDDSERIFKSLRAGASGYLLKRTKPGKLLEALEEVHGGGSPMSAEIARKVVQSFQEMGPSQIETENLTKREEEILSLLSKGYKYKEIAESLFISKETVRSHLRNIYEKLHVRSRTEAVVKYLNK